MQLVYVDVLEVGRCDGDSEGDVRVVPGHHAGQIRLLHADHIELRTRHMHQHAQRRDGHGSVRIVGHDRAATSRAAAGDRPVVTAAQRCGFGVACEGDALVRGSIDLEQIVVNDPWIEREVAYGVRRLEQLTQGFDLLPERGDGASAGHLLFGVRGHAVDANAPEVRHRPNAGQVADRVEFGR